MRIWSSLVDDSARAPLVGPGGARTPSLRKVRRAYAASMGGRAGVEPRVVHISVDRGYQPAQSVALANEPLRLVFHRRDADQCTERVVFSSPRMERRLVANGTTVVDLPAQPPGVVRFTCGMGRYHGEIELVERSAGPLPRSGWFRLFVAGVLALMLLSATGTISLYVAAALGLVVGGLSSALALASRLSSVGPFKHP